MVDASTAELHTRMSRYGPDPLYLCRFQHQSIDHRCGMIPSRENRLDHLAPSCHRRCGDRNGRLCCDLVMHLNLHGEVVPIDLLEGEVDVCPDA